VRTQSVVVDDIDGVIHGLGHLLRPAGIAVAEGHGLQHLGSEALKAKPTGTRG